MIFLDEAIARQAFGDAAETNQVFFNQQLTHILSRVFMIKHKQVRYREYFNINNEGDAGTRSIRMYVWDFVGTAKVIGHYADDLPSAGAGAAEVTVPVIWIGNSWHISWQETMEAQRAGTNLSSMRAMGADLGMEIKMNNIMFGTDEEAADAGVYGLFNNPNIPTSTVVAGAGGSTEWASKTADEILLDLNGSIGGITEATFNSHVPNKVGLPLAQWNDIATRRLNTFSDTTVLEYLVSKSPYLSGMDSIVVMQELRGSSAAGTDQMLIWEDTDEVSEGYIPYEKNVPMGTQIDGLAFKTPMVMSTAGLDVRFPLAYQKVAGI